MFDQLCGFHMYLFCGYFHLAGGAGGPLSPGRRAGPPPGRKFAGTIDVIGSTTNDSRRPARDFQEMPPTASAEAQDL
jgi:hypothetical protein